VEVPVEEEMLLQVLEEVLQEQQVGGIILDNQAQEGLKLAVALHGHWQGARPMELWVSVVLEVPVITQQAAAAAVEVIMAAAAEPLLKTTVKVGLAGVVADHLLLVVLAQEQPPKVFKAITGYVQLLGTFKVVPQP
jgi:hypothetical protein